MRMQGQFSNHFFVTLSSYLNTRNKISDAFLFYEFNYNKQIILN